MALFQPDLHERTFNLPARKNILQGIRYGIEQTFVAGQFQICDNCLFGMELLGALFNGNAIWPSSSTNTTFLY